MLKVAILFPTFFEYSVGLRQGEIISPVLVSLFLEDLELYLQRRAESGWLIDDISVNSFALC